MYSISHHHALFDKYSLSTDTSFTMPTIGTVVSVKKDGSPASYFEDDKWNFNDLFNTKGAKESKYTINFHAQKHNPELLLELKQRAYWLIWGGKGSLLEVEGAGTFRKIESIISLLEVLNPLLRIFKGTRINHFRYLSNEIIFSQIIESLKGVGEQTISQKLGALSVLTQVNPQFPEHQRFTIPYQDGQTVRSIAKKIAGKGRGHYPTVIPAIYEQFLSRTVNEVESAYLEFLNGRDFDADVDNEYESLLADLDISAESEALYQELTADVDIQERANKNTCSEEDIRDDFMKKAQEAVEITYRNQAYQSVLEVYKTNNPLLDVKEYAKCNGITEREAVDKFRIIEGACFAACSAFTGMRVSELTQIDNTSYKEVDIDGITLCTMRSWTNKLEKLDREDVWACAPVCKEALLVLTVLNDSYREESGNIHLSPRFSFDGSSNTGNNIKRQLKDAVLHTHNLNKLFTGYSDYLDVRYIPDEMDEVYNLLNPIVAERLNPIKANDKGELFWSFSTHSLRRTFAHFVVGHGLVSLASLKHQFKHINLSMTAIYASHSEVLTLMGIQNPAAIKKDIEEQENEQHREYMKDIIEHPEEQSGGYIKAFEGDGVITSSEFDELVATTKGKNKSTGFGTCFAGELCRMNHLFESSKCVGRDCENLNINKKEAENWVRRRNGCIAKIEKMKEMNFFNKSSLATQLTDIRAAEKVMSDHGIEFEKYQVGA
ncbi:site-specific integrase [Photobacterium leiognathi]|uniref:site-specific integrase n=1 Tax=Photobacterium leiognathi TaxID=553611 RepID=UPI0029828983|nr:site-specific integrase [Photobacterium leiognathi]